LDHLRQGVITGDVGRPRVHPHHQVEALGWRFPDRPRPDGAGVVDENIQPAQFADSPFDEVADRVFVAHVHADCQRTPSGSPNGLRGFMDAPRQRIRGLLAFGGHRHVGSFAGQPDCEITSDPAAGSGDHRHPARKVRVQHRSLFHNT